MDESNETIERMNVRKDGMGSRQRAQDKAPPWSRFTVAFLGWILKSYSVMSSPQQNSFEIARWSAKNPCHRFLFTKEGQGISNWPCTLSVSRHRIQIEWSCIQCPYAHTPGAGIKKRKYWTATVRGNVQASDLLIKWKRTEHSECLRKTDTEVQWMHNSPYIWPMM